MPGELQIQGMSGARPARRPSWYQIRVGLLLAALAVAGVTYLRVRWAESWRPDWSGRERVSVVLLVPPHLDEDERKLLDALQTYAFFGDDEPTFTALGHWVEAEYSRYVDREGYSPVWFDVEGPLEVEAAPPPPPRADEEMGLLDRYRKARDFLGYFEALRARHPPKNLNTVYVLLYRPSQASEFRGVHSAADRRSRSGFVFAELSSSGVETLLVNLAHELLHLYGARDQYVGEECVFPTGYVEPLRQPRFPQRYAEVMAQGIPQAAGRTEASLRLFEEMRVGVETAYEIGWIDRDRRDRYYAGDGSAGPRTPEYGPERFGR